MRILPFLLRIIFVWKYLALAGEGQQRRKRRNFVGKTGRKNGEGKGGKYLMKESIFLCRGEEKRRRKRRKIYRKGKCPVGQTDREGIVKIELESYTQNSHLYFLKVEFDWINYLIEPLQFKPQDCLNDRKGSWT